MNDPSVSISYSFNLTVAMVTKNNHSNHELKSILSQNNWIIQLIEKLKKCLTVTFIIWLLRGPKMGLMHALLCVLSHHKILVPIGLDVKVILIRH